MRRVPNSGFAGSTPYPGQRSFGESLRNHGVNRSLLSAMSFAGMLPGFLVAGSVTREVFES